MKKLTSLLLLLMCYTLAVAQQDQSVEMADKMRSSGKIYVVIAVVLIIFTGLAIYLFSIDRRLKKIERETSPQNKAKHSLYTVVNKQTPLLTTDYGCQSFARN